MGVSSNSQAALFGREPSASHAWALWKSRGDLTLFLLSHHRAHALHAFSPPVPPASASLIILLHAHLQTDGTGTGWRRWIGQRAALHACNAAVIPPLHMQGLIICIFVYFAFGFFSHPLWPHMTHHPSQSNFVLHTCVHTLSSGSSNLSSKTSVSMKEEENL